MNLTASVYTLKPSSIFYKGRIAFIVVLAATVFTAIYLIVCVKKGTFPTEAESDDLDEDEIELKNNDLIKEGKGFDPRKLLAPGFDAIKAKVKEKMELFGSVGQA